MTLPVPRRAAPSVPRVRSVLPGVRLTLGFTLAYLLFLVIIPSVSILAEPPVAVNETVAAKHGTTKVARAYLEYLYTDSAQAIGAKHFFRPTGPRSLAKFGGNFAKVPQFTVDQLFGGWAKVQKTHFADNGVFDQVYSVSQK